MEWTSFPQSKLFLLSCVISLQWVIFIKLLYKEGDYYYCYNLDPIAPSSAEAAFRWLCCTSFSLFCGLCKILQCSNEAAKWANLLGIGNLMREEVRVIPMSLLMNNTLLSCPLSLSLSLCPPPPSSLRSDCLPGDDGRGLRVGRPGGSDRPTADPPHLPLHQQRVCLLLVLRPGLRLLPLLPPGLWCGVRGLMSHTQTRQAGRETRQSRPAAVHRLTWQSERCHMSEDG